MAIKISNGQHVGSLTCIDLQALMNVSQPSSFSRCSLDCPVTDAH